jgi:hypothetical protein
MPAATKPEDRYVRPAPNSKLNAQEKTQLLTEHFEHCTALASRNPAALNAKIPREAFDKLLQKVGRLLLTEASRLANSDGPVRDFLQEHPLPDSLNNRLPPDFRAFCLAINALKQWVSAEQAATDRYLLGGTARARCRDLAKTCLVTGQVLDREEIELHHPIRDGRPPIPLSKLGHSQIENQLARSRQNPRAGTLTNPAEEQLSSVTSDSIKETLKSLKSQRHYSWVMLRRGCVDCLGGNAKHSTPSVGASSRTFARKAMQATGLSADQLLKWLDHGGL